MNCYHYATIKLTALIAITKVPVPQDSFLADDEESRAARELISRGYRLVATLPEHDAAIFEKVLDNFSPKVLAALAETKKE
jgi:hypothetical protein